MATRSCNAVYSSIIGCKTSGNYKELCLIFSSQSITTNQDQMPLFLCSPGKDLNWGLCSHYLFTSFLALGVIQKSESEVQSNSSWNPKVCLRSMQAKKFASDGRISHSEAKERYSLAQDLPQKVSEALLLFHLVMSAYVFIIFYLFWGCLRGSSKLVNQGLPITMAWESLAKRSCGQMDIFHSMNWKSCCMVANGLKMVPTCPNPPYTCCVTLKS